MGNYLLYCSLFMCLSPLFAYVTIRPSLLSPLCRYKEDSPISGWWCCPNSSTPVEFFKGRPNVSPRSYSFVRDECKGIALTVIPESVISHDKRIVVITLTSIFSSLSVVIVVLIAVIIACTCRYRHQRACYAAEQRNAAFRSSRIPLFHSMSVTLPTIFESRDNTLTQARADVRAASARFSTRGDGGNGTVSTFLGRATSTLQPNSPGAAVTLPRGGVATHALSSSTTSDVYLEML